MAHGLRQLGRVGQVTLAHVEVGVTDAADADLDEDLARPGLRHVDVLELQRLAELGHPSGLHALRGVILIATDFCGHFAAAADALR